jgi:hypothetical protein
MTENRFRVRSLAVEVLSIVLGVLLALGVNEWNENRIHSKNADKALRDIHAELLLNQKVLNTVHENNSSIVKAIAEDSGNEEERQFVPGLQIQDTAWQTMLATGINEHIYYDVLHLLSATYAFQEVYRSISFQMIQNVMTTTALATAIREDAKLPDNLFLENMELVVLTEEGLAAHYERALNKLNEAGYTAKD